MKLADTVLRLDARASLQRVGVITALLTLGEDVTVSRKLDPQVLVVAEPRSNVDNSITNTQHRREIGRERGPACATSAQSLQGSRKAQHSGGAVGECRSCRHRSPVGATSQLPPEIIRLSPRASQDLPGQNLQIPERFSTHYCHGLRVQRELEQRLRLGTASAP